MAKYVFVTGGVTSSLGKGITAASVGRLLKSRGLSVSILKLDPYINVDPGTMSPYQHGEVIVTDDGGVLAFHVDASRTVTALYSSPIFSDGFESGGIGEWSSSAP